LETILKTKYFVQGLHSRISPNGSIGRTIVFSCIVPLIELKNKQREIIPKVIDENKVFFCIFFGVCRPIMIFEGWAIMYEAQASEI
jgi:hypothetical protein